MPFHFQGQLDLAYAEPLSLIGDFLDRLERLFDMLAEGFVDAGVGGGEPRYDFRNDLGDDLPYILDAYRDLGERRVFSRIQNRVETSEIEGFEEVGLTGAALRAKLGLLESLSRTMAGGIRKALTYILALVNSILGSIASALTAGAALVHALKEFKDMLKAKIDLANDW